MKKIPLETIYKKFDFEQANPSVSLKDIFVELPELNRPALQLAGYFDYFDSDRLQIIGMVEYTYLEKQGYEGRRQIFEKIFDYKIPALILSRDLKPFEEMIEIANKKGIPLLVSPLPTTELTGELIRWLRDKLAPTITKHGVLVDIYGEGIMIMGESGIGKSETALELIKRGHRLVADDAVEIRRVSSRTLVGSCPEVIRHFIELRGIGIIDIRQMFGVESVKQTQSIDLIINIENWDVNKEYDRLGLEEQYMEILGNKVVCHDIPVRPGRNLAIICESAAVNHRQKKMGYNAAQVLNERIMNNMTRAQDDYYEEL